MLTTNTELCDQLNVFPAGTPVNFLLPGRSGGEQYTVHSVVLNGDHVDIALKMEPMAAPAPEPAPTEGEQ